MTNTNKTASFEYDASGQRLLTVEPDGDKLYTPFPNYQETHVPDNQLGIGNGLPAGSVIRRGTYYFDGQAIAQRQHTPVYADTFEDQLAQGWTAQSGNWAIYDEGGDYVYRQDWSYGTRTSSHALSQSEAMSYEWDMRFTSGQVKAGMLFYADTTNGTNAYRIWQRSNALHLQKITGGSSTTASSNTTATASNNVTYDYQVTYDPDSGAIQVYRDKVLVISWTDGTPHTSGNYLILRTVGSQVQYDDVQANEVSLSYLHSDHLGSNSLMTDAAGTIVPNSQAAYLPFGDWRNEPSTADLTDVGYTGHRHNNTAANDLGLIYMNARYYVPSIGRFASADTIIPEPLNPQSHNRFSYVENSPIVFMDPTGHCRGREYEYDPGACLDWMERNYGIVFYGDYWLTDMNLVWAAFTGLEIMHNFLGEQLFSRIYSGLSFIHLPEYAGASFGGFANAGGVTFFGTDFSIPQIRKDLGIYDTFTNTVITIVHELSHFLVNHPDNTALRGYFGVYEQFKAAAGWSTTWADDEPPEDATPYAIYVWEQVNLGKSTANAIQEDAAELLAVSLVVGVDALPDGAPDIQAMVKEYVDAWYFFPQ